MSSSVLTRGLQLQVTATGKEDATLTVGHFNPYELGLDQF